MEKIYHVFNKSIAEYIIFNNDSEYDRMKQVMQYYQISNPDVKFSYYLKFKDHEKNTVSMASKKEKEKLVDIMAYCIMPTHVHLILRELKEEGIARYMSNILNSYTRYFNLRHKRKGPLWVGRFKRNLIETDEELLHMTRYIHLNPTTSSLVKKPEMWKYSSYGEYLNREEDLVCQYDDILEINATEYQQFVEDRIAYQRDLAKIKHLIKE